MLRIHIIKIYPSIQTKSLEILCCISMTKKPLVNENCHPDTAELNEAVEGPQSSFTMPFYT